MNSQLQTIAYFDTPIEAHLQKTYLEANDIFAFIADEHFIGLNRWYSIALGRIKLKVLESDVARANELLTSLESENKTNESSEDYGPCLECGSSKVHYYKKTKYFKNVLLGTVCLYFFGLPWIFYHRYFQCDSCNYTWPVYSMNKKICSAVNVIFKYFIEGIFFLLLKAIPSLCRRLKKEWRMNHWA